MPLDLGQTTEPEPDILVVPGSRQQFRSAHPTTADLIVEVSDTNLSYDRHHKAGLYARAGIREYWIVNIPDRRLEVYRDPVPDPTQPFGHRNPTRIDLQPGATVSPLALPAAAVPVTDLLP